MELERDGNEIDEQSSGNATPSTMCIATVVLLLVDCREHGQPSNSGGYDGGEQLSADTTMRMTWRRDVTIRP